MICIIILNWNGFKDTIECLDSVYALAQTDYQVLVCDNCSTDGSIQHLQKWAIEKFEALTNKRWHRSIQYLKHGDAIDHGAMLNLLENGANLGFAAGNNRGAIAALKDERFSHVWFLNNDTSVLPDSLNAMVSLFETDSLIGLVSSTLVYPTDPPIVQAVGVKFNMWLGRGHQFGLGKDLSSLPSEEIVESEATYLPGASMLVSRAFLEKVGLMEENYFLYFEELDWALRNDKLFRMLWCKKSVVFHKEGGAIGTASRTRASDLSIYYQSVNVLRVAAKFKFYTVPSCLLVLIARACRFGFRKDWRGLKAIKLAISDFLLGRYRVGADVMKNA